MSLLPLIFALRVITTTIAIGLLVSFFASHKAVSKQGIWQARAWALMCAAVSMFASQYFVLEQFGLPIQHPSRQFAIGLALGFMWPSFQCARASARYAAGKTDREVAADQVVSIGVGLLVIAGCYAVAFVFNT